MEVENIIAKHDAVSLVAVVAKPDEKWGETPCAFIELKDGIINDSYFCVDYSTQFGNK